MKEQEIKKTMTHQEIEEGATRHFQNVTLASFPNQEEVTIIELKSEVQQAFISGYSLSNERIKELEEKVRELEDRRDSAVEHIDELISKYEKSEKKYNQEEIDSFALSFAAWYAHADDAQVYKSQNLSAYDLLQLYKDRPYLRTDAPESN